MATANKAFGLLPIAYACITVGWSAVVLLTHLQDQPRYHSAVFPLRLNTASVARTSSHVVARLRIHSLSQKVPWSTLVERRARPSRKMQARTSLSIYARTDLPNALNLSGNLQLGFHLHDAEAREPVDRRNDRA